MQVGNDGRVYKVTGWSELRDASHALSGPAGQLSLYQRSEGQLLCWRSVWTAGYTQNQNEALINWIWSVCPKRGYAGAQTIESAVGMAICLFNNGYTAI